jgi:hypothetical protein
MIPRRNGDRRSHAGHFLHAVARNQSAAGQNQALSGNGLMELAENAPEST